MSYFRNQRYASNYNTGRRAMTLDELRTYAPAAFAMDKHESRSTRYTYIPTVDVIEGMIRAGFQPFQAMQGGSRIEGKAAFTKHLIRFRHPDTQVANVGDTLPEVVLVNSHDGTSSYKLIAGLFRLVCANGLIVADSTIGSLTVPHKGDIVDKVIEGSFQIVGQSRGALDTVEVWKQLQLTNGEQQVFSEVAHDLRFGRNETNDAGETRRIVDTTISPRQLLDARRSEDMRNDLYSVFNRIQENAVRGGLRPSHYQRGRSGERVRRVPTREVRGIDQNVNLNRALWALTEKMAELKGRSVAA